MNSQPLVSVMLPFYNPGAAFGAALRSILWQSYGNWELLLCDDGSSDGSLELAREFARRDARIQVWSPAPGERRRLGLGARLNECIDRARGELLARMDADDISFPDRFERQAALLAAHPEIDLAGCSMLIFGEDGRALGQRLAPADHAGIVAHPELGFGLAHPTWMARQAWLRKHRYDPGAIRYEDIELLYRAYPMSRFANVPEILYGYREMRGGFAKRLRTRLGRIRYLQARRRRLGHGLFLRAAAAEAVKAASDGAIALAGVRYPVLRMLATPLDERESALWNQLTAEAVA